MKNKLQKKKKTLQLIVAIVIVCLTALLVNPLYNLASGIGTEWITISVNSSGHIASNNIYCIEYQQSIRSKEYEFYNRGTQTYNPADDSSLKFDVGSSQWIQATKLAWVLSNGTDADKRNAVWSNISLLKEIFPGVPMIGGSLSYKFESAYLEKAKLYEEAKEEVNTEELIVPSDDLVSTEISGKILVGPIKIGEIKVDLVSVVSGGGNTVLMYYGPSENQAIQYSSTAELGYLISDQEVYVAFDKNEIGDGNTASFTLDFGTTEIYGFTATAYEQVKDKEYYYDWDATVTLQNVIKLLPLKTSAPMKVEADLVFETDDEIRIKVIKTGPSANEVKGEPLKGIHFKLFNNDGEDLGTGATDINGELIFSTTSGGLREGVELVSDETYWLEETYLGEYEDTYELLADRVKVSTTSTTGIFKTEFEAPITNFKKETVKLQITKIDGDSEELLNGIDFTLFDEDGNPLETNKTEKGVITFNTDLFVGKKYTLSETNIPSSLGNYEKIDDIEFVAEKTTEIDSVAIMQMDTIKNYLIPVQIKVIKIDGDTGGKLSGVKFELYDADKNPITDYTTNGSGEIIFTGLEKDTLYYIREISNSNIGYTVDNSYKAVNTSGAVEVNGVLTKTEEVKNYKEPEDVPEDGDGLLKLDYDRPEFALEGVTFTIQAKELDDDFAWPSSASQGTIYLPDPTGEYGTDFQLEQEVRQTEAADFIDAYVGTNGELLYTWQTESATVMRLVPKYIYNEDGDIVDRELEPEPKEIIVWKELEDAVGNRVELTYGDLTTDSNGLIELTFENTGTFELKETKISSELLSWGYSNDNTFIYQDEEMSEYMLEITKGNQDLSITIQNYRRYIDVTGVIWIDGPGDKDSSRNNELDGGDEWLDGFDVYLMDGDTEIGHVTTSNGVYLFENVPLDLIRPGYKGETLSIEIRYNGLKYETVTPNFDSDDGSKGEEDPDERKAFNYKFSTIEANKIDTPLASEGQISIPHNNNAVSDVVEKYWEVDYHTEDFRMDASVGSGFLWQEYWKELYELETNDRILLENVNIGIYEREQADVALLKDLVKVRIDFNGTQHVYNYGDMMTTEGSGYSVSFESKNVPDSYSRPVYAADIFADEEYVGDDTMRLYATYAISVQNQASTLNATINKILDKYDSNYEFVGCGTELEANGDVKNTSGISWTEENGGITFQTSTVFNQLSPGEVKTIYVQFELLRPALESVIEDEDGIKLSNVAEITSFTSWQNGVRYGAIDEDSYPGNIDTNQDDTGAAPDFNVYEDTPREISGLVFNDESDVSNYMREGNGYYEKDDEKSIDGVEAVLMIKNVNGEFVEYEYTDIYGFGDDNITTTVDGQYIYKNFIAGEYMLKFVWGDEGYDVRDYKATVQTHQPNTLEENGVLWHIEEYSNRYSDAMDNFETRYEIDLDIKNQAYTNDKMDSWSPEMFIGIEYADEKLDDNITERMSELGDVYEIIEADFGIVKRANQSIEIEKEVEKFELYLQNGVKLLEYTKENGTTSETFQSWPPAGMDRDPYSYGNNGTLKQEMDNEILEGAVAYITYNITVKNTGEKDYLVMSAEGMTRNFTYDYINETKEKYWDELIDDDRYDMFNTYYTEDYKNEIDLETYYKYYQYGVASGVAIDENIIKLSAKVIDVTDGGLGLIETDVTPGYDWQLISFEDYNSAYMNGELTITEVQPYLETVSGSVVTLETSTASEEDTRRAEMVATDKAIMYNKELYEAIAPGESNTVSLETSKILSNVDEHLFDNTAEIVRVHQRGGSRVIGGEDSSEETVDALSKLKTYSETVTITPPTGENRNFTEYIAIAVASMMIIAGSAILIKKKVMDK